MKPVANDFVQSADTYRLYKGCWMDSRPPHQSERLAPEIVKYLLNSGGIMLRSVYNFNKEEPTSFWFVIKDSFGGLDELSSKMRNQVRKSLKTYNIRRINSDEFLKIAYPIYYAAISSYKVKATIAKETDWQRDIMSNHNKAKQYWGVFLKTTNEPIAVALNTVYDDCCEYNTLKCKPEYLHNSSYPYYGLLYEMNRYYLDECGLQYVNDGGRSVTEHCGIQAFLIEKFHFRKAYSDICLYYQWYVGLAVKLLYPFRNIIKNRRVVALLRQEAMARGEY